MKNIVLIKYFDKNDITISESSIPRTDVGKVPLPFHRATWVAENKVAKVILNFFNENGEHEKEILFDFYPNGQLIPPKQIPEDDFDEMTEEEISQENAKVVLVYFGNLFKEFSKEVFEYKDFADKIQKNEILNNPMLRRKLGVRRIIIQFQFLDNTCPMDEEIIFNEDGEKTISFKIQNEGLHVVFHDGKQIYLRDGKLNYFEPNVKNENDA